MLNNVIKLFNIYFFLFRYLCLNLFYLRLCPNKNCSINCTTWHYSNPWDPHQSHNLLIIYLFYGSSTSTISMPRGLEKSLSKCCLPYILRAKIFDILSLALHWWVWSNGPCKLDNFLLSFCFHFLSNDDKWMVCLLHAPREIMEMDSVKITFGANAINKCNFELVKLVYYATINTF
jgi:hypothetical protein